MDIRIEATLWLRHRGLSEDTSVVEDAVRAAGEDASEEEMVTCLWVAQTLRVMGLTVRETGGGCLAYGLDLPGGMTLLVTDGDGSGLPGAGKVLIGIYNAKGAECPLGEYDSAADAVCSLRNDFGLLW